ncbi:MAG: hypothetical protein ACR2NM_15525, partial [Bythopirellula sp.]
MNENVQTALANLGISEPLHGVAIGSDWQAGQGDPLKVCSPIDGSILADFAMASTDQANAAIDAASAAYR